LAACDYGVTWYTTATLETNEGRYMSSYRIKRQIIQFFVIYFLWCWYCVSFDHERLLGI